MSTPEDELPSPKDEKEPSKPLDEIKPIFEQLHQIEQLPPEQQAKEFKRLLAISVKKLSLFSGPVPPPELLKGYNEIIPNGADRILSMSEKQSDHRIGIEKHTIHEQLRQSSKGQNMGFALAIICIVIAAILAYFGHDTFASVIGGTTIIGLVSIFVIGKNNQKKDLENK